MINKTYSKMSKELPSSKVSNVSPKGHTSQKTVSKKNVRTTDYKKLLQIMLNDPDAITREEFMVIQSAIGYRQTVTIREEAKLRKKQKKLGQTNVAIKPISLESKPEIKKESDGKQEASELKNEKNPLQMKKDDGNTVTSSSGMPHNLRAGLEKLSGIDLSDVKVHRNSDKPQQVGALAYTQGNDIHIAPGQEKHLPHEGWHAVQQKQGRVEPTLQMKNGYLVNDNDGLEKEADIMGSKASNNQNYPMITGSNNSVNREEVMQKVGTQTLQMKKDNKNLLERTKTVSITVKKLADGIKLAKKEIKAAGEAISFVKKELKSSLIKENDRNLLKSYIGNAEASLKSAGDYLTIAENKGKVEERKNAANNAIAMAAAVIIYVKSIDIAIKKAVSKGKDKTDKGKGHELTLPDEVHGSINGRDIVLDPVNNWSAYEYSSKKGETGKTKEGRYKIAVGPKILNPNYPNSGKIWSSDFDKINKNIDIVLVNKKTGKELILYCYVADLKAHTYNKYNGGGENVSFDIESGLIQTGVAYPKSWNYSHETPFSEENCDASVIEFIIKPKDFKPNDYKLCKIITYN